MLYRKKAFKSVTLLKDLKGINVGVILIKTILNVFKYLMFSKNVSKSVVIIWERCLTVKVSHFNLQLVVDKDEEQKGLVST